MYDTSVVFAVWAIRIGIALGFAFLAAYFAGRKNRSKAGWGIAGFFLGFIPLLILAFCGFLCPNCQHNLTNEEWKKHSCPNCTKLEIESKSGKVP